MEEVKLNKTVKKILVGSSIVFSVLLIGLVGLYFFISNDMVSNNEIKRNNSTGKYTAVLFERDAGATNDLSYQISIINRNNSVGKNAGNIFICEYGNWEQSNIDITWKSNTLIQISYINSGIKIFKKVNEFNNIKIEYIVR